MFKTAITDLQICNQEDAIDHFLKHHSMKTFRGREVEPHAFLILT